MRMGEVTHSVTLLSIALSKDFTLELFLKHLQFQWRRHASVIKACQKG